MVKLTYYGHACFALTDGKTKLIIDPYLSGNPLAPIGPEAVETDYILVTHGHGDHLGDAVTIANRTGAPVVTSADMAPALGGARVIAGNIGGTMPLPFGSVKLVPAIHSSGVPGALACGFIVELGGRRVYHMGDTALTRDFELLAEPTIDAALIPIGDWYTMGPEDALRAVQMLRPRLVIPMHYNTFPQIRQDPRAFAAAAESKGFAARVLDPGCEIEL